MPLFVGTRRILRPVPSISVVGDTPTYVAAGTLAQSATTPNPTLSIPYYAGLAANDIAIIMCGGYPGSGTYTFPAVSGWTLANDTSSDPGFGTTQQGIYWRRLDGGESGNVSVALTGSSDTALGIMFGIRGCITSGTPYEDLDVNSEASGVTSDYTSQSITTTAANRLLLRMGMDEDAGTSSVPASWTQRFESTESIGGYMCVTLDTLAQATATTVSATTRTGSFSSSFVIHTMAMLPT